MTNQTETDTGHTTDETPPRPARKRWITPALALVAAVTIGLFGGILIGHNGSSASRASGTRTGTFPGGGGAGGGAGGGSGGFTAGTIASIDGDTITLTLADGSTVKVTTSSTTTVTKTDTGTLSDLAKGDTVSVIGATDSNGAVTATTVSEGALGFGGRTPTGTATSGG